MALSCLVQGLQRHQVGAHRLAAKGRLPEKAPFQAAAVAVIYSHLYLETSNEDEERERESEGGRGCKRNCNVAEIKGKKNWFHAPPSPKPQHPQRCGMEGLLEEESRAPGI